MNSNQFQSTQPPKQRKKNQRRSRKGPGEDRYFGRFHCKLCGKMWESACVYTIAGTMKVKYKQRCKNCTGEDAWCFPYDLEMILCSFCDNAAINCICFCEDCGKLWNRPRGKDVIFNWEEYCDCDRRNDKNNALGNKIDPKKPHERELCQRCSSGRSCWGISRQEGEF